MDSVQNILSNLPPGFFVNGQDDHLSNTQKFSTYMGALSAVNVGDPIKGKEGIPQSELDDFANWTGSTDTKVMAQDLMKKGLHGADQLLYDVVDTSSSDSVRNAQSDWKMGATLNVLKNALKLGISTPEEVDANKDVLIGNPRWAEAMNSVSFNNIHDNYWDIIKYVLLPEQYAKRAASGKSQTALK